MPQDELIRGLAHCQQAIAAMLGFVKGRITQNSLTFAPNRLARLDSPLGSVIRPQGGPPWDPQQFDPPRHGHDGPRSTLPLVTGRVRRAPLRSARAVSERTREFKSNSCEEVETPHGVSECSAPSVCPDARRSTDERYAAMPTTNVAGRHCLPSSRPRGDVPSVRPDSGTQLILPMTFG